jgi:tetratricopeptide (TPR) repeat protein/CHAT domain-containing protein
MREYRESRYREALATFERALTLVTASGDRVSQGLILNTIGGIYRNLGEYDKAVTSFQQALTIVRETGDRVQEARIINNLGSIHEARGDYRKALENYQQALGIFQNANDEPGTSITLNNIGAIYNYLGEYDRAIEYFRKALALFEKTGNAIGQGAAIHNIGNIYENRGNYREALANYQQALEIRRKSGDRSGEGITLNNLAGIYRALGNYEKATENYQQALEIFQAIGDPASESVTLNNLGGIYRARGEYGKALENYRQTLEIARKIDDRSRESTALNNMGLVYSNLGDGDRALTYYQQALTILQALGTRLEEGRTLNNIGETYKNREEYDRAEDYYRRALSILQAIGDRPGTSIVLNNLGEISYLQKNYTEALQYYENSLEIIREIGDKSQESINLNNIGEMYRNLGDHEKTTHYLQQALQVNRTIGDRSEEATILSNLASLARGQGRLQEARKRIEEALGIIEDLRTGVASPDLRTSYFATVQGLYQFYIDLLMELHRNEPTKGYDALAFHVSERSRARGLLDLLNEARVDIRQGVDPALLESERSIGQQLSEIEARRVALYSGKPTTAEKTAIEREREDLLGQYREVRDRIRATGGRYAALTRPRPLTLEQVQQQVLDDDTILLQYSLGKERGYLWVVTRESVFSYTLPDRESIESAAKSFYNLLANNQYQDGSRGSLAAIATEAGRQTPEELSRILLGQAAPRLTKKRLLIVADGALQYIPFGALPLPDRPSTSLLDKYEIVYLPSSSSLAILREETEKRRPADKAIAVLADPVFSADDERVTRRQSPPSDVPERVILDRSAADVDVGVWQRLPGTRREAETILSLVPEGDRARAFDFGANFTAATDPGLKRYRIVHYATHGILNSVHPELSGIVLSLVDERGNPRDGFLRLNNIFNLDLGADLVVLSACQTGLGKEVRGEGSIGLTRGFMYAGVPRVLVSLWNVSDEATAELMGRFYRLLLREKLPASEALERAQREMRERTRWKSPYYWAAFVLQGEWR